MFQNLNVNRTHQSFARKVMDTSLAFKALRHKYRERLSGQ